MEKLTSEKIYDVETLGLINVAQTVGVGLWTSICKMCADLVGCTSKRYSKKVEYATKLANNKLFDKAATMGATGVMEIRYSMYKLCIHASGTVYKRTDLPVDHIEKELLLANEVYIQYTDHLYKLEKGTKVNVISFDTSGLYYCEVTIDGRPVRFLRPYTYFTLE